MSAPEQPATELIQQPAPSALPALVGFGIALAVVGSFAGWAYFAAGLVLAIGGVGTWMKLSASELEELPRDQEVSAAVIEPTPARSPQS